MAASGSPHHLFEVSAAVCRTLRQAQLHVVEDVGLDVLIYLCVVNSLSGYRCQKRLRQRPRHCPDSQSLAAAADYMRCRAGMSACCVCDLRW